MKKFYRKKGKYADGRDRIIIEDRETNKSLSLPKPEELWNILCTKGTLNTIVQSVQETIVKNNQKEGVQQK